MFGALVGDCCPGRWGGGAIGRCLGSSDRKIRGARVDSCCVASSRPAPTFIRRVGRSVRRLIRGGGVGCCRGPADGSAVPWVRSRVVSASTPSERIRLFPLVLAGGRRCTK